MRVLCLLVLITTSASAAAQGFEVDAELDVQGQTLFRGVADADFTSAGLYYHSDVERGAPQLVLHAQDSRVRLIDYPLVLARTSSDHPIPNEELGEALPPEELYSQELTGVIRLVEVEDDARHFVLPRQGDDLHHAVRGRVEAEIGLARPSGLSAYHFQQPHDETGYEPIHLAPWGPSGSMRLQDWNTTATGVSLAFLHGGSIDINGERTVWTGTRLEQGASDPAGLHDVQVLHRYVLLVEGDLEADVAGTGWHSAIRTMQGDWHGDFEFSRVASRSTIRGEDLDREMALLQVIGDVEAVAAYEEPPSSWRLGGEATFVGVDGATWVGSRDLSGVAIVGVGLLALVWIAMTNLGREFLSVVTSRNVANPLARTERVEILRTVARHPGIDRTEVGNRLGLSKSSIRHHVGILLRAGEIVLQEDGNRRLLSIPGTSPDASVQQHPTRQTILDVLAEGEATYAEMVRSWRARGMTVLRPDAVSYHGRRLEEAGIVRRRREKQYVVWSLRTEHSQASPPGRAYIVQEGLADIHDAVQAAGRTDARQVHDALASQGRRMAFKHVRHGLRRLYAVGLLDHSDGTYHVAPDNQVSLEWHRERAHAEPTVSFA